MLPQVPNTPPSPGPRGPPRPEAPPLEGERPRRAEGGTRGNATRASAWMRASPARGPQRSGPQDAGTTRRPAVREDATPGWRAPRRGAPSGADYPPGWGLFFIIAGGSRLPWTAGHAASGHRGERAPSGSGLLFPPGWRVLLFRGVAAPRSPTNASNANEGPRRSPARQRYAAAGTRSGRGRSPVLLFYLRRVLLFLLLLDRGVSDLPLPRPQAREAKAGAKPPFAAQLAKRGLRRSRRSRPQAREMGAGEAQCASGGNAAAEVPQGVAFTKRRVWSLPGS
jgi:hypothetical protein